MPTAEITRAYSRLVVREVDTPTRRIKGVASTPEVDRLGDVIEPLGITFTNPAPLLLFHKTDHPVGLVTFDPPTADGLTFTAELPTIDAPGALRDRVDEAWACLAAGLVCAVSIGFRAIEHSYDKALGGFRFLKTEVLELSLVTIPAHPGATARVVKALDGAREVRPMEAQKTTAETIRETEGARHVAASRMAAIMNGPGAAGETLDATLAEEYDGLCKTVDAYDTHLTRLRALERAALPAATRIESTTDRRSASEARGGVSTRITVTSQLPAGVGFVRAVCARVRCKGNNAEATEYARERWPDHPEIATFIRAAVAAGTATDATWAGPLVPVNPLASEFLALLRPATLLGKIAGLKDVPFNVSVPKQTAGGTYKWVGEAKPKPLTKLAFGSQTLGWAKAAGIIVISEELARLSTPSAEALVTADMIAGIAAFLDAQFIDPAVAAVAGVNPASITNGAPNFASTGPAPDLLSIIAAFSTANMPLSNVTIIMSEVNALSIAFIKNTDGSARYPGMSAQGGAINGIRVVTSNVAGTNVIGLVPDRIMVAGKDAPVEVDLSREASVQMDDAPMSPADATTVYVSLWQNNLIGLRAEKFTNWARVDTAAVKYATAANYAAIVTPSSEAPTAAPSTGKH